MERFQREATVLAGLQHPGVVKIHRTGWLDEGLFLLMEFVEGESLARRREPLTCDESARITRDLADAVAALHAQGILHRDIKPGEAAARGGETSAFVWGDVYDEGAANCMNADGYEITSPSGALPRDLSATGCYDMTGNVSEYVADVYAGFPAGPLTDPTGPRTGKWITLRGGSWASDMPAMFKIGYRFSRTPTDRTERQGFRVALSAR